MTLARNLPPALHGLASHKLRTFLSMLGVIFGVAAVVAMMSIGEGARREALRKYGALGVDNILVREPPMSDQELRDARTAFSRGLSLRDVRAIQGILGGLEAVAPQRELELDVRYRDATARAFVVGTVPAYLHLIQHRVELGRFFREMHLDRRSQVCVLGAGVRRRLFPLADPLGERVKLGDQWFQVVGVMEPKGATLEAAGVAALRDLDMDVYVPLSASLDRLEPAPELYDQTPSGPRYRRPANLSQLHQITLRVARTEDLEEVAEVLRRILLRRHHGQEDFVVLVPRVLLEEEQKDKRIFDLVLASIAGISLMVGGIGIMNIMLASVLERTREIGLRLAVGARRRDILEQFVAEAALISLLGGGLGIFLGFAMAFTIDALADFRAAVSPVSILIAFGVAALVGLVSGIYPAGKAAKLNPIEALRYE